MINGKYFVVLMWLMISLLAAGCADKKKVDEIANTQKEISVKPDRTDEIANTQKDILARLDKMDEIANTQRDILARLDKIDEGQKNISKAFQPSRPAVDLNKVHKIPVAHSKIRGNEKAPVTIVEFSDFQCPFCSKLQATLEQVLKAYPNEVRLVFKDFPLSFHTQAKNAARAAHAAGEQGKYWEMHDVIFKNFDKLNDDSYKAFAEELKLDVTKFVTDYTGNKYDKQIQDDINLGISIDVGGTPTLFINGKRMSNRSFDDFKTAIEGYRGKK